MKTRKLLAIVLAGLTFASFVSIPVFAEGEDEALETLGILVGTGDGVTEDYLATTATRAQAALIHLRLMGLETDALAFDGEETFTDAADATEYWQPVLEYLKANEELGWQGYPDGSFDHTGTITGHEFTKVILVALGYEEEVDFTWEDSTDFAASLGIEALVDKVDEGLLVKDLAVALVEALGTKTTADIDVTLLTWLVMEGVISAEDAEAAGFVVEEPALKIVSAGPTAIDEITVEMSTDVPDDTAVALKRGSIGIVTENEIDGSTVVLTGLYKFLAGTYTVTVGEETASFVIESQTATDLIIGADTIYDSGEQDLKVKLADQYGDAMSLTGANISVFNQSTGYVFTPDVSTTVKITIEDIDPTSTTVMNAKAGDVVYVFVYDPASGLTATKELLVMEAPYIASLEIGGVTIAKDGDTVPPRLYPGTSGHILTVTAKDQYNKSYTLKNADIATGEVYGNKVQILTSNNTLIPKEQITVEKGNLKFNTGNTTGSARVTLIVPDQGFIATSDDISVYARPVLTKIEVAGPAKPMYVAEAATLTIVGIDQYGGTIKVPSGTDKVTFTQTVSITADPITVTADNKAVFTPNAAKTTTVYYFVNGVFQDTLTLTVNPEAVPFQIAGVTIPGALQTGVSVTLTGTSLTVIDQYGRTYGEEDTALEGVSPFGTHDDKVFGFVAEAVTTDGHVDLITGSGYELSTAGLTAGTDTFKVVLVDGEGEEQPDSTFVFEMKNIAAADIDGFAMGDITTMYAGTNKTEWNQDATDYDKTVAITGTADGVSVKLLDEDDNGLPDIIDVITSSNAAVEVVSGSILTSVAESDTATTVRAWRNGAVVASTEVNLEKVDPDLERIEIADNDMDDIDWYLPETFADTAFVYYDQYGVELDGMTLVTAEEIIIDCVNESTGDWDIMIDTELWWFSVIKKDGTVWATRYVPLDKIFS